MSRPNVLFIMSDQMKASASHVYGNPDCRTPSMERLATEGVLFRNAFTPHPLCVPARTAVMASRYPHQLGTRRNETLMPSGVNHAFRVWKNEGYRTGLIGKNHCFEQPDDLELFDVRCEIGHRGLPDNPEATGMEWARPVEAIRAAHAIRRNMPWHSPRVSYAVTDHPEEDRITSVVTAQTERFLERHAQSGGDAPFALWVSYPDPHEPYEAPESYADMFPPELLSLPPRREGEFDESAPERNRVLHRILGMEEDDEEHVRRQLGVYYAMVRFVDDGIGRILDALERLGLRENTIVVFTSDHGDFAGEHNMFVKGGVFYDCLTRVPLVLSWPGRMPSDEEDDSMVNTIDIVPTLLRLQGIDAPREMYGQPLPTVTEAAPRDAAFSEYGAGGPRFRMSDLEKIPGPYGYRTLIQCLQWREAEGRRKMARTREWKYVHDPTGDKDELYDMVNDPWELFNVAEEPANAEVIADMRRRLADWAVQTEDAVPAPLPAPEHYEPWSR
ncbi:MAG: sulfatase [Chloroflexota bacterium]